MSNYDPFDEFYGGLKNRAKMSIDNTENNIDPKIKEKINSIKAEVNDIRHDIKVLQEMIDYVDNFDFNKIKTEDDFPIFDKPLSEIENKLKIIGY